ncbi:hypothetical protein [Streptomyces gobiensis]|uniref:hypothetical protein n=1 Tax=Streptomyces gobiensis TaxID=2875706 RepID=UPI001E56448B|nr:hypothetical protein [Streptomyces gobiensis]UGY92206.1 hypothetical protein test1122_11005 [Streptomyces gobiensis]
MPTPHGSRGGMAFSADELRVLRRALANALQPAPVPDQEEVRECLMLAQAVNDVTHEAHRLRAFLTADLVRYRDALPGSATGYLERLQDALEAGYVPTVDDLAAVHELCAQRTGPSEAARRTELLTRVVLPAARTHLYALPGGRSAEAAEAAEAGEEKEKPKPDRTKPPAKPAPSRPVPTPAEVFPPRRRPTPAPSPPPPPPEESYPKAV